MSRTTAVAPGLWDALRGTGARRDIEEFLDRPNADPAELAVNLGHLRLLNRILGWSAAAWRELEALLRRRGLYGATVLDIATGSADIPRDLMRRAAARGLALRVIASDVSRPVLAQARAAGPPDSRVRYVQHDGTALPFRAASVDVALCSLAAHHFDPAGLSRLLAELWRVARHGVIVSDLVRGRAGYLAARLMALVLRNRLTSHDGPVSVLRAYTPAELYSLANGAGISGARVRTFVPARMTLVAEKGRCP